MPIKLVFCLKRHPTLSREAFQAYWKDRHAPLVAEVARGCNIVRYTQSHSIDTPLNAAMTGSRGLDPDDFDGVAELWWDSEDDVRAASATAEGRALGKRLLEDEARFIDLGRSTAFFTREHVVIDG